MNGSRKVQPRKNPVLLCKSVPQNKFKELLKSKLADSADSSAKPLRGWWVEGAAQLESVLL
jgi:hypothetical protein